MLGAMIMKSKASSGFLKLNQRDISSFMDDWRDDAVFIYPGNISVSGEHKGKEKITAWWKYFMNQFPEVRFTCKSVFIKNIYAIGPTNEIALHWEVSTKDKEGNDFKNAGMSLVKVKNGKIQYFKDYIFDLDTVRKAWSEDRQ